MPLAALLLSRDPGLLSVVRRGLEDLAIRPEICPTAAAASEALSRKKFEAIILDVDDTDGGRNLLRTLRTMPSNRNSIVFAVLHNTTTVRDAFEAGMNFAWEKPVTADRVLRSLRAAHSLMVRERRRAFRQPIDTSVMLQPGPGPEMRARGIDLSEGGMAVMTPERERLKTGCVVRFRFMLPDTSVWLDGKAMVIWSIDRRAGIQFQTVRNDMRVELAQWLGARLDQEPTLTVTSPRGPESARPGRRDLILGLSSV